MALQLQVESLEGLDESVQQFYQQDDDGKYRLAVEGMEDTDGLKSALEKERKARKDYEKKMKNLEDVDPDEYRKLKEQQKKAEEEKLQKDGEFEKLREKWSKEREQEKQKYEEQLQKLNNQLDQLYLRDKVKEAAIESGVRPERSEKAIALAWDRVKRGDDGSSILVLDSEGDATDMTLKDFFSKEFKEELPEFYRSDVLPGGGTKASERSGKGKKEVTRSEFDQMDQNAKYNFMRGGGKVIEG
jgi:DNA repair exonuclease SbcCD ATPase subunit